MHNHNAQLPHCTDIFPLLVVYGRSMAVLEAMPMKIGDLVLAQTFSEGQVTRRVVEKEGDTIYICTEEEWLSAQKEHREPLCVGFNSRYIAPVTAKRSYHLSVSNA